MPSPGGNSGPHSTAQFLAYSPTISRKGFGGLYPGLKHGNQQPPTRLDPLAEGIQGMFSECDEPQEGDPVHAATSLLVTAKLQRLYLDSEGGLMK